MAWPFFKHFLVTSEQFYHVCGLITLMHITFYNCMLHYYRLLKIDVHCCKLLLIAAEHFMSCQLLLKIANIAADYGRSTQIATHSYIFPKLLQIASDCCILLQIAADCCRLKENAIDCCRLLQMAADCCRWLQIERDCHRLLQIAADCTKMT